MSELKSRAVLDTLDHVAVSVRDVAESVKMVHIALQVPRRLSGRHLGASRIRAMSALLSLFRSNIRRILPSLAIPPPTANLKTHRDGTSSVYIKDPDGTDVEILALARSRFSGY